MKNQYFGDSRDLFKYDLVNQIINAGIVRHLTLIPMLTQPDDSKQGAKTNRQVQKVGGKNVELTDFLSTCVKQNRRNIKQLKKFFGNITIYREDGYLRHEQRREYFDSISNALLTHSLILVDPDIGLQIENSSEKHLLYAELKGLYKRMDENSILMVYQHFPRVHRQAYLNARCTELKDKITGDWPVCIDDGEVIFFLLTKDSSLEKSLVRLIGDYAESYS